MILPCEITCLFFKPGFHAIYYIGTIPLFVRAKTCFFGIILCTTTRYSRCGQKSYSIMFSRSSPNSHFSTRDLFRQLVSILFLFPLVTSCIQEVTAGMDKRSPRIDRSGLGLRPAQQVNSKCPN